VRARQPRQRGTRRRIQRQRRLERAHRLVVGGGALFVDHRCPVAPCEARLGRQVRELGAQLQRRLGATSASPAFSAARSSARSADIRRSPSSAHSL
jgi:hypothetical protein